MYVSTSVYRYIYSTYTHIYTHIYIYMYICIYVYKHTYTYIYIYVNIWQCLFCLMLQNRALTGRVLMTPPGQVWAVPLQAEPLWATLGPYGRSPCGPPGAICAGPF